MKRPLRWVTAAALALVLAPAPSVQGAGTRIIEIAVRNGVVTGSKSVRVLRGDTVVLRWTSDKPFELHLHGYDLTVAVHPGSVAEMKLEARATGRFPVEIHTQSERGGHAHKPLFHLEVYPE